MIIYTAEEKIYCVYKITNLINDKGYVGQTYRFKERMKEHCTKNSNSAIHLEILKCGKENFSFEIIEDNLLFEDINEKESYYIKHYNTLFPNGYNLTTGGESCVHLEKTKQQISNSLMGHKVSKETKLKQSVVQSGEKHWTFGIKREEHPNFGKTQTYETKLKRSGENHWTFGLKGGEHPLYGLKRSELVLQKHRNQYLITFPDGHQEITNNLKEFCIEYNLSYSAMLQISNGRKNPIHKGFKCEHYNL